MTSRITPSVESSRRGRFRVTKVTLQTPSLPKEFEGYRIAHLTDLHYGPATNPKIVDQALEIAQSFSPDLFVLTGDFVVAGLTGVWHRLATKIDPKIFRWTEYRRKVRLCARELAPKIAKLSAPDGLLGVLGNHDHIEGLGTIRRQLPPSLRFLINDSTTIERGNARLYVAGVDDYKRGRPNLARALSAKSDGCFSKILLSHNPDIVLSRDSYLLGDVDLVLCGHTHGGQIRVPGWGPVRSCTRQQDHIMGLTRFAKSAIYTNSGVGHVGIPLRLFCPPEIAIFEYLPST